jgi:glycine cleavage system H protein
MPVSGKAVEINEELEDNPALINSDPYGRGWILKVSLKDEKELRRLMNVASYEQFVKRQPLRLKGQPDVKKSGAR